MTEPVDQVRWRRLSTLFDQLIELPAHARERILSRECADDPALRAQLERMLLLDEAGHDMDDGVGAVLRNDPALAGADEDAAWIAQAAHQMVGVWQLDGVLGAGGVGAVFAARRMDETAQRAAVKRLRQRWDGSVHALRFLQERRILATLSHPNIPGLLDYGIDDEGRPWFAMSRVDGLPITEWADAQRLTLTERLTLFLQVAAAVQHAHSRFVVHRDLKPGNILVDADGHPMVLDFGVAKWIDRTEGETRTGLMAGFTPEYAAPEQVTGGPVTAATDVYALGVLLYQMICGRLPYDVDALNLRKLSEAISDQAPLRFEQALASSGTAQRDARLAARGIDFARFRRYVRGDLARILQTTLAKEPERRYASVEAFAQDLRAFLDGRPVSVAGDTFAYRAGKFLRRNRAGVAMAALALLALLAGTAGVVHQGIEAQRQERRAVAEAQQANAIREFMFEMMGQASPQQNPENNADVTVREFLDTAREQVDQRFAGQPGLKGEVLASIADIYADLGDHALAAQVADAGLNAIAGHDVALGLEPRLRYRLGAALVATDRRRAHEQLKLLRAWVERQAVPDDEARLSVLGLEATLAAVEQGPAAAWPQMQAWQAAIAQIYGENSEEWAAAAIEIAYGAPADEAVRLTRNALAFFDTRDGDTPTVQRMLARWSYARAESATQPLQALEALEQSLVMAEHFYGPQGSRYARTLMLMAKPRSAVGPLPQALDHVRQARAIYQATTPGHPLMPDLDVREASLLQRMHAPEDARRVLERCCSGGSTPPHLQAEVMYLWGRTALDLGDIEQAQARLALAADAGHADDLQALLRADVARARDDFDGAWAALSGDQSQGWAFDLARARLASDAGDRDACAAAAARAVAGLESIGARDVPELDEARSLAAR